MFGNDWPDFEKIQKDNKRRGDEARMLADDGVTPEVGGVYSVSPSFQNGDRSWVDEFWQVIGQSGPNVLVKIHDFRDVVKLFRIDDRAWYPADEAFAAFQKAAAEQADQ